CSITLSLSLFFFNDTATPQIYTLSLHDALPISTAGSRFQMARARGSRPFSRATVASVRFLGLYGKYKSSRRLVDSAPRMAARNRSEEHTSELQSRENLVCRLLLEKKKKKYNMSK